MKYILAMLLMFSVVNVQAIEQTEVECLAKNIYFEAGNQSDLGKLLVGIVTLNRVYDFRYPNTICSVVRQKNNFSWYWDGISDISPKNGTKAEKESWIISKDIAQMIIKQPKIQKINMIKSFPATHYHAVSVLPFWIKDVEFIAQIDDHKFYQWIVNN